VASCEPPSPTERRTESRIRPRNVRGIQSTTRQQRTWRRRVWRTRA
jgi:hypothetical protein